MENQSASEALYEFPALSVNQFGWGPSSIPDQFGDLPFSLFSRDDNLGMIVELTGPNFAQKHSSSGEGNEGDFTVVETTRTAAPRKAKLIHTKTSRTYNTTATNASGAANNKTRNQQKKNSSQYQRRNYDSLHIPSIPIKSTWQSVFQVEFSDLAKLTTKVVPTPTTFAECGSFNTYNNDYDSINLKKPVILEKHDECGSIKTVSVMKDPFIAQVAESKAATVYTTDTALACIMAVTRSQLSWDLEIVKNEKGIFISHRDTAFDLYQVNETSTDMPTEEESKDDCLRKEVTDINRDLSKQIMTDEVVKAQYPSPFEDGENEKIHRLYRYRKVSLSDNQVLMVRTTVHGQQKKDTKVSTFNAYAINEWCSRTPLANRWRTKLNASSSYPLVDDMKNNFFRLSRWGVEAVLAGVDNVKIGYVSRRNMKNVEDGHNILSVQNFPRDTFSSLILLNEKSMWAITEYFIKILSNQEDGHYIMMKDPMKGIIRIYKVSEEDLTKIEEPEESEYSESEYSDYSESEYSEYSDEE